MKFLMVGDAWGRMFTYNEWIAKLFPNFSEYQLLRDFAMQTYAQVKVFLVLLFNQLWFQMELSSSFSTFLCLLQELVEEQLQTYDPDHERHFLDQYFKTMQENGDKAKNTFYCKSSLLCFCSNYLENV